ncbi:uncharacterized protein J7T54_005056 [Emericellopsis cladophorae]|uniref:Metallo-beta-lactamase domain-containing protein n=1 Tax=Emericellopsis cladophorae TaxID=2686198 RepID=A0A9Q0B9P1_9HYPO|nr:uncharacterized protein J7T54_005056 [Emericellopsis cladophorae]KAI6778532.1 hypothetical protein J7T54_005056 [Emericellopsis cladophorae]
MSSLDSVQLKPSQRQPLLKSRAQRSHSLEASTTKSHPRDDALKGTENASLYFVGTATTILEWEGIRLMTDPNFLHAGDQVHLGPGVTAERRTNPALELDELPSLDGILLSHYHEDHFDRDVEDALDRNFLIVTTPHARQCLTAKDESFCNVHALDFFQSLLLVGDRADKNETRPVIKVTGMPGKHIPSGFLSAANDLLGAVPPTNGWMLELGHGKGQQQGSNAEPGVGYRIYISGDTLFVDDLKRIPEWLNGEKIDLMLIHLGGTSIPSASAPLVMVTMDAVQGLKMMRLMDPDVTVPIHFDDYSVFASPLNDFKKEVQGAGMEGRVVYLDRGEKYAFTVRDCAAGAR